SSAVESVEVRWPSGKTQRFENLAADKIYKLVEGKPTADLLRAEAGNHQ
ncbi:MAG: ASPIC/UnbV domain-containing protein, partial [Acidobacteria bacterium]|nr:ASPIC/UnbV domain-containing protein [Acidobacteriota bacterium]